MVDKNCHLVEYQLDDATRVPTGDFYCKSPLRGKEKGEFGEDAGLYKCDCNDSKECSWNPMGLEKLTQR